MALVVINRNMVVIKFNLFYVMCNCENKKNRSHLPRKSGIVMVKIYLKLNLYPNGTSGHWTE